MSKPKVSTATKTHVPTGGFFKCACNASARFIPVYRFSDHGEKPGIAVGPLCPATVQCVSCKQMYVWHYPDGPAADGGWRRESALDDLLTLEASGG